MFDHFGRVCQRLDLFVAVEIAQHRNKAFEFNLDRATDSGLDSGVHIGPGLFRSGSQEVDKLFNDLDFSGVLDASGNNFLAKFLVLSINNMVLKCTHKNNAFLSDLE